MSDVLEELYRVKRKIVGTYSSFDEFGKALLERQSERRRLADPIPIARRAPNMVE